jgi:hypothetical protein
LLIFRNIISFNCAINSLAKGSHWCQALHCFAEVASARLQPDVVTYNATMTACGSAPRNYLRGKKQEVQFQLVSGYQWEKIP